MPDKTPSKLGTITQAAESMQKVTCDDGTIIWLIGVNRIPNAQDGDRVRMAYRQYDAYALWFGRIITEKEGLRTRE